MTVLYGISNCDTVRKARGWLDQHAVDYHFHDLRRDGLTNAHLQRWLTAVPDWETLVNRRSTTWKQLDESTRRQLNEHTVGDILLAHPTLIKRPLVEHAGTLMVGFKEAEYQSFFHSSNAQQG